MDFLRKRKTNPSSVNQLLSQIRTLQDKVIALHEENEFSDPETDSNSEMPHDPGQQSRIPSPGALSESLSTSALSPSDLFPSRRNCAALDQCIHHSTITTSNVPQTIDRLDVEDILTTRHAVRAGIPNAGILNRGRTFKSVLLQMQATRGCRGHFRHSTHDLRFEQWLERIRGLRYW